MNGAPFDRRFRKSPVVAVPEVWFRLYCNRICRALARVLMVASLPHSRGTLVPNRLLKELTWLRVGGSADWLFLPADFDDLRSFLLNLESRFDVFPMGVGSNLIVRDGGIRAVVVRLGRGFNGISIEGDLVTAGAGALDAHVARKAAAAGLDLTFLRTIPGSVGGAVRMNAGCYGTYVADRLVSARAVTRSGEAITLTRRDLGFRYRQTDLPAGTVITSATFEAPPGEPAALERLADAQLARRDATQPVKDRTAGSTFRNPSGRSSTESDACQDMNAWQLIDRAGLRGFSLGGAKMSSKHPNFLTNTGSATAEDLENLGELVRKKVFQFSGIHLEWELIRVGEPERGG